MATRRYRHIRTGPAPKAAPASGSRGAPPPVETPLPGLPPKPDEMSYRDYLIMLLHIAAEIEHGLMVEYLYAAYSLGGPGAAKHPRQVREWHDIILTIAREEMGHLLTVQNALLLVGGPVSFEREDYPWSNPFYPFDFRLEPLSLESLATYVYAEMPQNLDFKTDQRTVEEVKMVLARRLAREKGQDAAKIVKGLNARTVGEIYAAVLKLVADRSKIPDTMFDASSYKYQATWDEWGRGYRPVSHQPYAKHPEIPPPHARKTRVIVAQMATRTEMLQGLGAVAGQGEAEDQRAGVKVEPSHFDRFAKIFRAYYAILKKDRRWSPSRRVPVNPVTKADKSYQLRGSTEITDPASSAWASLFNVRYRILLTMLTFTYRLSRDDAEASGRRRAQLLSRIFGEMYNLKAIAGVLVRLPLGDPRKAERAGPPFQMPYTLIPPGPEAQFWRLQLDLLEASRQLAEQLLQPRRRGAAVTPTDGLRCLKALLEADRESRTWTEQLLEGLTPTRRSRA